MCDVADQMDVGSKEDEHSVTVIAAVVTVTFWKTLPITFWKVFQYKVFQCYYCYLFKSVPLLLLLGFLKVTRLFQLQSVQLPSLFSNSHTYCRALASFHADFAVWTFKHSKTILLLYVLTLITHNLHNIKCNVLCKVLTLIINIKCKTPHIQTIKESFEP